MKGFLNKFNEALSNYYYSFIKAFPKIIFAVFLSLILWMIYKKIKIWTKNKLITHAKDQLLADFFSKVINSIFFIIGVTLVLYVIGFGGFVGTILAGAGVSAIVLGFAFKDIGENFLAGILLAFKRPFRVGDRIDSNNISGKVIGLNLRETIVSTLDGKHVYLPNSLIVKNPLINHTIDGFLRTDFTVGIDYDDNIEEAILIINNTLKSIPEILNDKVHNPSVAVDKLATSTVNIVIYFWIETDIPDQSLMDVKTHTIKKVLLALVKAGYYLPADIIEVKNYNSKAIQMNDNKIARQTNNNS